MNWFDVLAVQGTLKSLLQQNSSKASILQHSAFFMVQLSHPYTTTGKTIALTIKAFVSKVMSLLSNMLYRFCFSSKEQASFNFMASFHLFIHLPLDYELPIGQGIYLLTIYSQCQVQGLFLSICSYVRYMLKKVEKK